MADFFNSERMYAIAQFIRTLMPIMAAIGTVSSAIGLWRMFNKWHKPGILSLIPFARGWIFGRDSDIKPRLIYSISDGVILVLTPIFYWIRATGTLTEAHIWKFTFYVDRSMIIITVFWAIAEIMRFYSSVHISANLVKKNKQKKRWVLSWIFLPKFSKVVWGFSNRYVKEKTDEDQDE